MKAITNLKAVTDLICSPLVLQKLGDKSIDTSHWVMMTDVLPGSKNKSYSEQQKIVADLTEKSLIGYEVPETLAATACILSQFFDSNTRTRLFIGNNPWTYYINKPWNHYAGCKENIEGTANDKTVVVGGLASRVGLYALDNRSTPATTTTALALRPYGSSQCHQIKKYIHKNRLLFIGYFLRVFEYVRKSTGKPSRDTKNTLH